MNISDLFKAKVYIQNFLKIRDKNANLVPLKFNDAQELVDSIIDETKAKKKPVRLIILKARQLGMSTYTEARIFHDTATTPLKNSLIIAHEDPASQNLFQMYKTYYENIPPELTPMKKYSNSQQLLFENPTDDLEEKRKNPGLQSKVVVASARNVNTGRSSTIHNLHASEVAFWSDAKTLMTGLMQTIPDSYNSMVIIESTANGVGGWFYDTWKAAERGENDFTPIFLPWFTDPNYTRPFEDESERKKFIEFIDMTHKDQEGNIIHTEDYELMTTHNLTYEQMNWRRYTTQNKCGGDAEMFCQEYPSTPDEAFITSGRPRFNATSLKKYLKKVKDGVRGYLQYDGNKDRVKFIPDKKGYVEIWKMPVLDEYYCIGADVAEGLIDGDYSCAYVGDSNFDIVAKWYGHIDPDLYGKELVKLAKFYNEAYIGCERNNHGLTTLKAIQNEEYYNIYYTKTYDKIADTISQKIGWDTTTRTKPMMIDKLAEYIRERWLGLPDKLFVSEALSYIIEDNGSTNAQEGCHDDTVMSTGILLQMLLEGKGDSFTPSVPKETVKKEKQDIDRPKYRDDDTDNPDSSLEVAL